MATVTTPRTETATPESRVLIPGVDWKTYQATLDLFGHHRSVRFTYNGVNLEIMSPSPEHEDWAKWLDYIIVLSAAGLRQPCRALGMTTWRKEVEQRGLEADACFYLANFHRVRGKKRLDLNVDPPPDLAVEVEISRSAADRMEIYARLGVPEVWRYDGESLSVWQLQPDGTYAEVEASPALPLLRLEEVVHWLQVAESTEDMSEWIPPFQAWVNEVLVPRAQGA